jgi:uncharacterized OB-fold protein
VPLPRRGALFSSTVIHHAPKGFTPPYSIGLVDLPNGVRVLGRILSSAGKEPAIGDELQLELAAVASDGLGGSVMGPAFRSANTAATP